MLKGWKKTHKDPYPGFRKFLDTSRSYMYQYIYKVIKSVLTKVSSDFSQWMDWEGGERVPYSLDITPLCLKASSSVLHEFAAKVYLSPI